MTPYLPPLDGVDSSDTIDTGLHLVLLDVFKLNIFTIVPHLEAMVIKMCWIKGHKFLSKITGVFSATSK